jgi:hypothetical protein
MAGAYACRATDLVLAIISLHRRRHFVGTDQRVERRLWKLAENADPDPRIRFAVLRNHLARMLDGPESRGAEAARTDRGRVPDKSNLLD